ncbi:uncharacterized protein LOC131620590 [Vicia villosa]|uniref:uncharacterized protein LOC131620590 n=1 Tax=Vicia villosa TaxID=3911 RepID=UPI00273B1895|nr:uncharacterized protein LOC131620590 [Vicia villosa]
MALVSNCYRYHRFATCTPSVRKERSIKTNSFILESYPPCDNVEILKQALLINKVFIVICCLPNDECDVPLMWLVQRLYLCSRSEVHLIVFSIYAEFWSMGFF